MSTATATAGRLPFFLGLGKGTRPVAPSGKLEANWYYPVWRWVRSDSNPSTEYAPHRIRAHGGSTEGALPLHGLAELTKRRKRRNGYPTFRQIAGDTRMGWFDEVAS